MSKAYQSALSGKDVGVHIYDYFQTVWVENRQEA